MTLLNTSDKVVLGFDPAKKVYSESSLVWQAALPPFPAAPLLDDFNRLDNTDIGPVWVNGSSSAYLNPFILVNEEIGSSGSTSQMWSAETFSSPCEIYAELPIVPPTSEYPNISMFICLDNNTGDPINGDAAGYLLSWSYYQNQFEFYDVPNYKHYYWKQDVLLEDGDWIGMRCADGVITSWHKSGTDWEQLFEAVDSQYSGGYISLRTNNETMRFDNVCGGLF